MINQQLNFDCLLDICSLLPQAGEGLGMRGVALRKTCIVVPRPSPCSDEATGQSTKHDNAVQVAGYLPPAGEGLLERGHLARRFAFEGMIGRTPT